MDLVRHILLFIESSNSRLVNLCDANFEIEGELVKRDILDYHADMLKNAKFIEGQRLTNGWIAHTITWNGHELLDNIRDSKRWELIKNLTAKAGTFSLAVLYIKATNIASKQPDAIIAGWTTS
jgi:hypothetical protein